MRTDRAIATVVIEDLMVVEYYENTEKQRNRAIVQAELDSQAVEPLSFELFKKETEEKNLLLKMKNQWMNNMRASDPNFTKKNHKWTHTLSFDKFKQLLNSA